jgi:hypothetical protein
VFNQEVESSVSNRLGHSSKGSSTEDYSAAQVSCSTKGLELDGHELMLRLSKKGVYSKCTINS